MNPQLKTALLVMSGIVVVVGLLVAIFYVRRRLFTRTEPIVLTS